MSIRTDRARSALPPPTRIDRGVPGVFHRGAHRRRARHRRFAWTVRERRLGSRLEREMAGWALVLHSRVPTADLECQPIDHLVVAPAGVWVIVADHQLGRLTRSAATASVAARREEVRQSAMACRVVLSSIGFDWLDVHIAVCATNTQGAFRRPLLIDGVWVARPSSLTSLISRPGPLNYPKVATVAAELSRRFLAAR